MATAQQILFFPLLLMLASDIYAESHPGSPCSCTQFTGPCSAAAQQSGVNTNLIVNTLHCAKVSWHQSAAAHADFITGGKAQIYPAAASGAVVIDACSICADAPSAISGTIHLHSGSSASGNKNSNAHASGPVTISNDSALLDNALQSASGSKSAHSKTDQQLLDDALNGANNQSPNALDIAMASTYTSSHAGSPPSAPSGANDLFEQERQAEIERENVAAAQRAAEQAARQQAEREAQLARQEEERQRQAEEDEQREQQDAAWQQANAQQQNFFLQQMQAMGQGQQQLQQFQQNMAQRQQALLQQQQEQRQQQLEQQKQRQLALLQQQQAQQNAQRQTSSSNNNSNNYGSNSKNYGPGVSALNFPSASVPASKPKDPSTVNANLGCTVGVAGVTGRAKRLDGPGHCDGEVVGFLTNNSGHKIVCSTGIRLGDGTITGEGRSTFGPSYNGGGELSGLYWCAIPGSGNFVWSCITDEEDQRGCKTDLR